MVYHICTNLRSTLINTCHHHHWVLINMQVQEQAKSREFWQGGQKIKVFFVFFALVIIYFTEGREPVRTTILSRQLSARQQNAISMAFCWWADDGTRWWRDGGGGGDRTSCTPPPPPIWICMDPGMRSIFNTQKVIKLVINLLDCGCCLGDIWLITWHLGPSKLGLQLK